LLLLSHQIELIKNTHTKILGLCSGYGGGKTFAVARKAVMLMRENAGHDGIVTEPNYPLLLQILVPELKTALEFFGIPYKYNKVESIFYCIVKGVETRIICKSMENYERLVGVNAAWVVMDEFDTAKPDLAYNSYLKLLGRIRAGNIRQMVIVSTPEGFGAMYRIFITENNENKHLIRAKTTDNKHLPADYIETLRGVYSSNLLAAYLDGEFVNLNAGSVYHEFDRKLNASNEQIKTGDTLHCGMDFNVTNCSVVVHVIRDNDTAHAVNEITGVFDTPSMARILKERYPTHKIMIYPDASGNSRKSNNASESDHSILRAAGFQVLSNNRNPFVKDRVLSVNNMIHNQGNRRYFVNPIECPSLVESLEKQAYDSNGEPDKKSGFDHVADATGYFIAYRYPVINNRPSSVQILGI
jgi:hypothetical protein